jgi:integrase
MRLKDYNEKPGKRVWLSESEISRVLNKVDDARRTVAFLLAARCGMRKGEIVDVSPVDIRRTDIGEVVRIWDGKGDKYRETPAPPRLTDVTRGIDCAPDESYVDVDPSTVYRWVSRVGEELHGETGDRGWLELGPHDLRRSWGVQLLERGVLPSVVMEWGGWEDWRTFRNHYLAEFSPEALRRETQKVDFLVDERMQSGGESVAREGYSVLGGYPD